MRKAAALCQIQTWWYPGALSSGEVAQFLTLTPLSWPKDGAGAGMGCTHKAQSTAMIRLMSSVGSPTEVSTMTMVTSPAWGMPAAPMLAAVAVMLHGVEWKGEEWGVRR